jgi:hypothetical protein
MSIPQQIAPLSTEKGVIYQRLSCMKSNAVKSTRELGNRGVCLVALTSQVSLLPQSAKTVQAFHNDVKTLQR